MYSVGGVLGRTNRTVRLVLSMTTLGVLPAGAIDGRAAGLGVGRVYTTVLGVARVLAVICSAGGAAGGVLAGAGVLVLRVLLRRRFFGV